MSKACYRLGAGVNSTYSSRRIGRPLLGDPHTPYLTLAREKINLSPFFSPFVQKGPCVLVRALDRARLRRLIETETCYGRRQDHGLIVVGGSGSTDNRDASAACARNSQPNQGRGTGRPFPKVDSSDLTHCAEELLSFTTRDVQACRARRRPEAGSGPVWSWGPCVNIRTSRARRTCSGDRCSRSRARNPHRSVCAARCRRDSTLPK